MLVQICDRFFLIHHGVKLLAASLEELRRDFDPRTILVEPLGEGSELSKVPGVVAPPPTFNSLLHNELQRKILGFSAFFMSI